MAPPHSMCLVHHWFLMSDVTPRDCPGPESSVVLRPTIPSPWQPGAAVAPAGGPAALCHPAPTALISHAATRRAPPLPGSAVKCLANPPILRS
ncbi:hypothetical protein Pmani_020421 [Petrolisthes manimaculis]|uniref:Uncharacterized protein n=1 Tax=Petrolisthes manimaculis TaxID=1843537 RepID=A0AAE1PIT3_9EUCA|nr:hypothetical protein Pmani_020421 [Petrolisthes manimaculis]